MRSSVTSFLEKPGQVVIKRPWASEGKWQRGLKGRDAVRCIAIKRYDRGTPSSGEDSSWISTAKRRVRVMMGLARSYLWLLTYPGIRVCRDLLRNSAEERTIGRLFPPRERERILCLNFCDFFLLGRFVFSSRKKKWDKNVGFFL